MHFMAENSCRGEKRELEHKKFKLLGQVQTLKSMFTCFIESSCDPEVLQGDQIYQNIYVAIHNLYLSKIDHKFILDVIDLKNQKRESRRFINFLEGAQQEINAVTRHQVFQFDPAAAGVAPLYHEAE
mmetsp:Transcript_23582/g.36280  ORF Transcript_23582/g.36280 Transcript_23582/m.36280 type:complete len:127 (-) Transcript_23582:3367-3747(-)